MILTGDLILESAKRGISFPSNNANNLSDPDILAFAYEEMISKIMPLMTSIRQEYLIAPPYSQVITAGVSRYRIPQRALARNLRNIIYIDGSGNTNDITMVTPEDRPTYMPTSTTTGTPRAFYIENDYIVLLPTPAVTEGSLEITYPLRPSKIIQLNDAGVIQSADPVTSIIVLETALSTILTTTPLDIISHTSGNIVRTISITPSNVSTNTITFPADSFDSNVEVGDYLCLAEQSPVAQIPEEAHVLMARATQNRILEAIDDFDGLEKGKEELYGKDGKGGLIGAFASLFTPRVEGKSQSAVGAANLHFVGNGRRNRFPRVRI